MSQRIPKSTTKPGCSGENNLTPIPRNMFQKSGSEEVYEVMETKDAIVYRVDMPGCPGSDLVYSVDSTTIHFFADEPAKPEYNYSGRKYGGSMVLNAKMYNVEKTKVKLANGVLWMTVPKFPGVKASVDTIDLMLNCKITREDLA